MLKQFSDELSELAVKTQKYVAHLKVYVRSKEGIASGLAFKSNGIIITNYHVIDNVEAIDVTLEDGNIYSAEIVGKDKFTDLALLHIDKSDLQTPEFIDSDTLSLAQIVLALGNPLGFQLSITMGIISGLNRSLPTDTNRLLHNLIQTDAALSPGSSGGPLVNTHGQVIGINTAIITGVAQGLCFAIPSNTVEWISSVLLKEGVVTRGFLGLAGETVATNPQIVGAENRVLKITGIAHNSPADNIIKYNDYLVSINERRVTSFEDISKILDKSTIGKPNKITVLRDNTLIDYYITPTQLVL